MTKTFTQDDLIRYIYGETYGKEKKELEKALVCDAELQEAYKELAAIKNQLDYSMKEPSERVVDNILNYSKSLNLPSNK